jgi:lysozyme
MRVVCPAGPVIKGIDIYQGNMISDINLLKSSGIVYAFHKAFEYRQDPKFKSRWDNFKRVGIARGAYDFFHPGKDVATQASNFLGIVGQLEPTDMGCVLDWEVMDGLSPGPNKEHALKWLDIVERATKKTPGIYGSSSILAGLGLDQRFKKYWLWIANYGVPCPHVPPPWDTWTFWQTDDTKHVPGIAGACDRDLFNGSIDQFHNFIKTTNLGGMK